MSNEEYVYTFFKKKGLSNEAISGIMGNLHIETGGTFSTKALNKNENAYGIAQWRKSRRTGLEAYAKSTGQAVDSIKTQTEYIWRELNTTEKRVLTSLQSSGKTPAEYAEIFDTMYERSDGSTLKSRQKYADEYYNKYSNSSSNSFIDKVNKANEDVSLTYLKYAGQTDEKIEYKDTLDEYRETAINNAESGILRIVITIILIGAFVLFLVLAIGNIGELKTPIDPLKEGE